MFLIKTNNPNLTLKILCPCPRNNNYRGINLRDFNSTRAARVLYLYNAHPAPRSARPPPPRMPPRTAAAAVRPESFFRDKQYLIYIFFPVLFCFSPPRPRRFNNNDRNGLRGRAPRRRELLKRHKRSAV